MSSLGRSFSSFTDGCAQEPHGAAAFSPSARARNALKQAVKVNRLPFHPVHSPAQKTTKCLRNAQKTLARKIKGCFPDGRAVRLRKSFLPKVAHCRFKFIPSRRLKFRFVTRQVHYRYNARKMAGLRTATPFRLAKQVLPMHLSERTWDRGGDNGCLDAHVRNMFWTIKVERSKE